MPESQRCASTSVHFLFLGVALPLRLFSAASTGGARRCGGLGLPARLVGRSADALGLMRAGCDAVRRRRAALSAGVLAGCRPFPSACRSRGGALSAILERCALVSDARPRHPCLVHILHGWEGFRDETRRPSCGCEKAFVWAGRWSAEESVTGID